MSFDTDIRRAADIIASAEHLTIVSHIDADGITSESIIARACARAGIRVNASVFVRQLEPKTIERVPVDAGLVVFTDLGIGQQAMLVERGLDPDTTIILDHHVAKPVDDVRFVHVNALDAGHAKLAAAGVCYFVAREMDGDNIDLALPAIVGNVGDMMGRESLGLTGIARDIIDDGLESGVVEVQRTLNIYGISTRPVHIALAYADDPHIPGISNDMGGALAFLEDLSVDMRGAHGYLVWEELGFATQRVIVNALVDYSLYHDASYERLVGETYIFPNEQIRTPTRNASEFATMLNACGRWDRPDIGAALCRGSRGNDYKLAERMLTHHKSAIRALLEYIVTHPITEMSHIQVSSIGNAFPDTIIGIGAGMALSKVNPLKPMLVMGDVTDDPHYTKISMRTTDQMVARGIDLQAALSAAAAECCKDAAAGGHAIAAGAYIPKEIENVFIETVNKRIGEQVD